MSSFLVAIRRLRDERAAALGLAILVLVTALVFGLAPRLLDRAADGALRGVVDEAGAFARNIALIQERRLEVPNDDPFGPVTETGDELLAEIPPSVQGLIGRTLPVVDSPRWSITAPTPDPSFIRYRVQPGAVDHLRFVAGGPPTAATTTIAVETPPRDPDDPNPGSGQEEATVMEGAISAEASREIGMGLGDVIPLIVDTRDVLAGPGHEWQSAIRIVGIFEVIDETDPFWYDDPALARASIRSLGGDSRLFDVTALIADDSYPTMMGITGRENLTVRYTWRYLLDSARLEAEQLPAVVTDLKRLDVQFPSTRSIAAPGATSMRSGLLPLLTTHERRWSSAFAILTVAAIGPAAVALAALGLVAVLAARRRRPALAIVRGRGASLGQVVRAVVLEGAVLAIPAVGLATVLAILILPASANRPTVIAGTAVALAAIGLLVVTALPGTGITAGGPAGGREPDVPRGTSPRRLVFEALVVVLAGVGAWLLRERGVSGGSSATDLQTADPLVAAVPALAGIAAGLAAIRIVPLPLRLFARLAKGGRGFVPLLALRRATHGGTTAAVLIVLLATASIGAFSSAALAHLDRASDAVAWQQAGAPFQIASTAGSLPIALDPVTLPGVEAAATGYRQTVAFGTRNLRVELLMLDAAAFQTVVAGTGADPGLPAAMLGEAGSSIPIIISTEVATRPDGVPLDESLDIVVDGYHFLVEPIEARDAFPAMPIGGIFAVASRDQFRALHPEARLLPTIAFLRAPDDAGPAIRDAVAETTPAARVTGHAQIAAELRQSPVTSAIVAGIAVAALIAIGYAALAVASALALAGASRAVEVAHLRMIGLSRREALGLVAVEHGPTVILAFTAGVALGIGLFALLRPGLGLDGLVGSRLDIPIAVPADQLVLIGLAILAIVSGGVLLAAAMQRRAAPVAALRRGFE